MTNLNLHLMMGPYVKEMSVAAEKLEIMHISTDFDDRYSNAYTLQMSPVGKALMVPVAEVVKAYDWSELVVFYEEAFGNSST